MPYSMTWKGRMNVYFMEVEIPHYRIFANERDNKYSPTGYNYE